ncbi:hypothetical protein KIH75_06630 [Bifidobacterium sp. 64T4]|uniref:hypothetical protein n=1 Tax=Bifidobacterium pongonis TaxID=2834432 RepID=UPI001C566236|nr:hypothetical protein [Bifidobacterium pongonis]MBW3095012.1 hypothetical protein [Bifidobacterium pongonis]
MAIENELNEEYCDEIKRFSAGADNNVSFLANGTYDVEWYIPLQDGTCHACKGQVSIRDRTGIRSSVSISNDLFETFRIAKLFPGAQDSEWGGLPTVSGMRLEMLRGTLLQTNQTVFALNPVMDNYVFEVHISAQTLIVCVDDVARVTDDEPCPVTFDAFECDIEQIDRILSGCSGSSISVNIGREYPIADLMDAWIGPLQILCSLVADQIELIDWVFARGKIGSADCRFQVVGEAIMNQLGPEECEGVRRQPRKSVSLDEMKSFLLKWQETQSHPIVGTYGNLALQREGLLRSRFLLLIQALEGEYNSRYKMEIKQSDKEYKKERKEILQIIEEKGILSNEQFSLLESAFPRKSFMRATADGLLKLCKETVPEVEKRLDANSFVARIIREQAGVNSAFAAVMNIRNKISHGAQEYDDLGFQELVNTLETWCRYLLFETLGASKSCTAEMLDW